MLAAGVDQATLERPALVGLAAVVLELSQPEQPVAPEQRIRVAAAAVARVLPVVELAVQAALA